MKIEVEAVEKAASTFGWMVCSDLDQLTLWVAMRAHNGDRYVVRMTFHNYRENPPAVEFVDPRDGTTMGPAYFPKGRDSFFNTAGPCICAPINLKAYRLPEQGNGLHSDWPLGEWHRSRAQNFDWAPFATACGILWLIQSRLDRTAEYLGRMSA